MLSVLDMPFIGSIAYESSLVFQSGGAAACNCIGVTGQELFWNFREWD